MGQLWVKTDSGTWDTALPSVKDATGWKNGRFGFVKTGTTTWTQFWQRDTTAPGAPGALSFSYNATSKKITLTVTAPSASDVRNLRIKVSSTAYPTSTTTSDAYYISTGQPDGTKWSDPKVTASQTINRVYPASGTVTAGKTYYFSVWAQDTSNNFSTVRTGSFKVPVPTAPTPPSVTKSAYVLPTDSASYTETYDNWRTSDNYVYQAGTQDWRGLWFYSTRISSLVKNAKRINSMSIHIGRVNNGSGVNGGASVYLHGHKYASQPSGDPVGGLLGSQLVGTLNPGEYDTFTIPSSWYDDILAGSMKGFALRYGNTSYTAAQYLITYGAGTTSGRLYVNWTE